jgi:hypothetical protein
MKNISLKQIILLIIIFFFLFGDFYNLKKKFENFIKSVNNFILKKIKKKGT